MKYIQFPIIFTTVFLFIYVTLPPLGVAFPIIFSFFILMHVFYFWMIYAILKKGQPSERTFNEHWYDDVDIPKHPED